MSLMRGTTMGLLAAAALVSGLGGCALPHVLPVETTTTSGPSPYGVWYEQHWATNSVLLAAADAPNAEVQAEADDTAIDAAVEADVEADVAVDAAVDAAAEDTTADALDRMDTAVEASAVAAEKAAKAAEDFDNSTPYQFPASSFAPQAASDAPAEAAPGGGPIRY